VVTLTLTLALPVVTLLSLVRERKRPGMPNCESRGMILRSLTPTKRRRVRDKGNGNLTLTPTLKPSPRVKAKEVRGRVRVRVERANPKGAVLTSTRTVFNAKVLTVTSLGSLKVQDTLTVTYVYPA
jgi:hypothetical protein